MKKPLSILVLLAFIANTVLPTAPAGAQELFLPPPGAMVGISPTYTPIAIKGLKIFPDNPFRFDFILDTGNSKFQDKQLEDESNLLIKYFLTALTVPDDDQWVNLSPYEKDRVIPEAFGITEMGRDLLTQDYLLKQLTASLIYPEQELGKKFWARVYKKAEEKYGDINIPVSTFNKVWIMPDHAKVYESGQMAFIIESHLKVMLEEDYVAMSNQKDMVESPVTGAGRATVWDATSNTLGSEIIREIVLPEIEKEINEGQNFTKLRQVYQSMIMASWFKKKLKDGMLSKVYIGANKVAGIDIGDKDIKQKIYNQYIAAFKKGVYNYVKEEYNDKTKETTPRKYFSGGFAGGSAVASSTVYQPVTPPQLIKSIRPIGDFLRVAVGLNIASAAERITDPDNKPLKSASSALVELPVFSNARQYTPYDPNNDSIRQDLLANINASIAPRIKAIIDGSKSLSIIHRVVLSRASEHLLENAVNAIIRRLDAIHEPEELKKVVREAKINFSYRENIDKKEFEIALSDNGDGVADEIYDAWLNGREATTKANTEGRFSGPTIGGKGLAVISILDGSKKDGFTFSFESKKAGDSARKFIQQPNEEKSIVHFPPGEGRTEVGTTITITGPLAASSSIMSVGLSEIKEAYSEHYKEYLPIIERLTASLTNDYKVFLLMELATGSSLVKNKNDFIRLGESLLNLIRSTHDESIFIVWGVSLIPQSTANLDNYLQAIETLIKLYKPLNNKQISLMARGLKKFSHLIKNEDALNNIFAILMGLITKTEDTVADNLFQLGFEAIQDLVKSPEDLKTMGDHLVSFANTAGENSFDFFINLRDFKNSQTEDFERYWPGIVEICQKAGNTAVFELANLNLLNKEVFHGKIQYYWSGLVELGKMGMIPESRILDHVREHSSDHFNEYWPTLVNALKKWKDQTNNLSLLLNVERLTHSNNFPSNTFPNIKFSLIQDIIASGVSNFAHIFDRLYRAQKTLSPTFIDFVANRQITLSVRMKIIDEYMELLAMDRQWLIGDSPEVSYFHTIIKSNREQLEQLMKDLPGQTVSQQRKTANQISRSMQNPQEIILSLILQRPLTEDEVDLLRNPEIQKEITTIFSIFAMLSNDRSIYDYEKEIQQLITDALGVFFSAYSSSQSQNALTQATTHLNAFIHNQSTSTIKKLIAAGYSDNLWTQGIDYTMEVSDGITEEGKKETIRRASHEIIETVLKLGIKEVNGIKISIDDTESLDSYAKAEKLVRAVEKILRKKSNEELTDFQAEKLDRMDDIIYFIQNQEARKIIDIPRAAKFRVTIKKDFFKEATAGLNVPGCYHPTGVHREKPPMNAFEPNAGFIQIYSEEGKQVANAEIIYTEQGVYVYPTHSNSFYNLDTVFGTALAQLTEYVPQIVLDPTSAGYNYLKKYAPKTKQPSETITLVKPHIHFTYQYFDSGSSENGRLTLKIIHPLIVKKADIIAKDGSLREEPESAPLSATVKQAKPDIEFQQFANLLINKGYKEFLFMVNILKNRVAQEGKTVVDDNFYNWVAQIIKTNPKVGTTATAEQSDIIADLMIDFLETQKWPVEIETPRVQEERASSSIGAVVEDTDINPVGGIDMSSKTLDLETTGEGIQFDMPFDPTQLQNIKIDGFSPVILQIIPANLPLFIGINQTEAETQLSAR